MREEHDQEKSVNLRQVFLRLQEQMIAGLSTNREVIQHPGTKGAATELHWLKMLNDYLPKRYQADSAVVLDSKGRISDQIDVVIYDRQYSPFLFNQDNALYIPAESVYAAFEVRQSVSAVEHCLCRGKSGFGPSIEADQRSDYPCWRKDR